MDATRASHAKRGKSERERQIPYDITYMWNLKYGTDELTYRTETDTQDIDYRLVVAKGEWGREWDGRGSGVGRCKRLHLERINNKVLLQHRGLYPISWDRP